jgi:hypothetical protein
MTPRARHAGRSAGRIALAVVFLGVLVAGCTGDAGDAGDADPQVRYKPPFLPVEFIIGPDGVDIEGDRTIVTPIGVFETGATYALSSRRDSIYVVIRGAPARNGGSASGTRTMTSRVDQVYQVRGGGDQFTAVVNGTSTIQVSGRKVLIDVTRGGVNRIQLRRAAVGAQQARGEPTWLEVRAQRWGQHWRGSWYKPMMLSRWAYDDSTIGRWYGLGFVWFMVRFVAAIVLFLFDIVGTVVCVPAALSYVFFGATGRNIVYGIAAVFLLPILAAVVAGVR